MARNRSPKQPADLLEFVATMKEVALHVASLPGIAMEEKDRLESAAAGLSDSVNSLVNVIAEYDHVLTGIAMADSAETLALMSGRPYDPSGVYALHAALGAAVSIGQLAFENTLMTRIQKQKIEQGIQKAQDALRARGKPRDELIRERAEGLAKKHPTLRNSHYQMAKAIVEKCPIIGARGKPISADYVYRRLTKAKFSTDN